jgi:hypothetical protein
MGQIQVRGYKKATIEPLQSFGDIGQCSHRAVKCKRLFAATGGLNRAVVVCKERNAQEEFTCVYGRVRNMLFINKE